jgi:hydroxyacylglutathione hydrolase
MHRAGFGSKLAWLADREQEIVLIGRDDQDGHEAGKLALAVGIRKLGGYLHGGMTSWRQEKRPTNTTERVAVEDLEEHRTAFPDLQILDVRDQGEFDAGHIPGSTLVTWHDITTWPKDLDPDLPVAVICGSGQRAATAASLVVRHGGRDVVHVVDGGVPKWGRLGHDLQTTAGTTTT